MAVAATPVRRRNPIVVEDERAGWVFLAPAMSIFLVFIFGSILFAFYLSFHNYALLQKGGIWPVFTDPGKTWVGLDNYRAIFKSGDFWRPSATRPGTRSASFRPRPLPVSFSLFSRIAPFAVGPFSGPRSISPRSAPRW